MTRQRVTALLIVSVGVVVLLTSCQEAQPDFGPIGDGMRALGICIVVASVVLALASLIRSEQRKRNQSTRNREDQTEES